MKKMIAAVAVVLVLALTSCGVFSSLSSTTYISPNKSFELGNNAHGPFKVQFQNASAFPVEVYQAPVGGGRHSGVTAAPSQTLTVQVEKNTALIVVNNSADTATVKLRVTGDIGLSMGYKK